VSVHGRQATMSDEPLLLERVGSVASLTLNRPTAGNSINLDLARSLMEASITCDDDNRIKCVVLTGAGKLFCGGGDVAEFAEAGSRLPALLRELLCCLHAAVIRLAHMNKPLVTVINGPAAGAGFSLAILGDIALAARSAHFTLAYSSIGLSPDGGSTWMLPRLIGLRRAQELSIMNKRLSAEEALQMGLVTRVIDEASLRDEAKVVASQLAVAATRALGRTRSLLLRSFESSLDAQLDAESQAIVESSGDAESREGLAAFLAKRKPNFEGSVNEN
jgi:2-(1,2-epoxy-1,2-dihydrophenyl)acetyl-CoA isomerase